LRAPVAFRTWCDADLHHPADLVFDVGVNAKPLVVQAHRIGHAIAPSLERSDHVVVIDYKTGKRFGNEIKHAVQLQLYAVCALIRYPDVEQVTCELWYFDQNELASFTLHRRQLTKYLAIFDGKGRKFTETTNFKPNPNIVTCKYCPYHPDRQGNCKYGTIVSQTGKMVRPIKPIVVPKGYKVDAAFADEAAAFIKLGE